MDVGVYSKKIIVKKLVLVTVPDFQQSHLQMAWEFVFFKLWPQDKLKTTNQLKPDSASRAAQLICDQTRRHSIAPNVLTMQSYVFYTIGDNIMA